MVAWMLMESEDGREIKTRLVTGREHLPSERSLWHHPVSLPPSSQTEPVEWTSEVPSHPWFQYKGLSFCRQKRWPVHWNAPPSVMTSHVWVPWPFPRGGYVYVVHSGAGDMCCHVQSALLGPLLYHETYEGDRKGWGRRSPQLCPPVELEPPNVGTAVKKQCSM